MNRSILYVDDELDNLLVFEAAFEDDFHIRTANSGKEALEILDTESIPVIVADQRMPGMSGAQLFAAIRQRCPETKRILLTGYTDPDDMAAAINDGQIFHFIKKPWDRNFLFSILVRAFQAFDLEIQNSALMNKLVIAERCASLGRAMSRIAHEMGNLVGILPLLEHIEEDYSHDVELMQLTKITRETCERLNGLIGEVKSFVRFEHGAFPMAAVTLSEVVYQLVPFIRYDESIPEEQFQFEIKSDATVRANKVKLQQVLHNLVKNAADVTRNLPNGKILLTVEADDSHAILRVTDNGCGIPEESLERIWEPYFTTKGDAGTGLGLDIARRLIENHDGVIHCRSQVGQGTTFEIRLPRFEFPDPQNEQLVDEKAPPAKPAQSLVTQDG